MGGEAAGALLISSFLSGGILDRYARRRPTRARGFFAACGAHLGAMLRTWLILLALMAAFHAVVQRGFENPYIHSAAFAAAILLAGIVVFAQVRIAVEDRRSAMGALLGGGRFLFRNPAALAMIVGLVAAGLLTELAHERVLLGGVEPSSTAVLLKAGWIAAETFIVLTAFASSVSLFQARLAHAGYTAAPPPVWPDSPAAETISNAPPTMTS